MKKEYKKYESRVGGSKIEDVSLNRDRKKEKKGELMPNNFPDALTFTQQMLTEAGRRQQMSGKVVMCSYCGKVFYAKGTRKYCYGDACRKAEKRYRQSIVDGLAAAIKKGLYANFKLFREVLPNAGEVRMDYDNALKKGFDEHAFYGTYINKHNDIWHIVGEYYFTITHQEDDRFLHLLKLKKNGI
jgi:hypothetical protein